MVTDSIEDFSLLDERKNIIITLCKNYFDTKLREISVQGTFTNANLLMLLDNILEEIKQIITIQINQLRGEMKESYYCLNRLIDNFEDRYSKNIEIIVGKILKRSFMNEKIVSQAFNNVDKATISLISTLFHELKKCLNSEK